MRTLIIIIAFLLSFSSIAMPENIILVRHAEKQKGVDPSLTQQGIKRAQIIAQMMLPYEPTKLYSTNYNRTKATLAPLADLIDTHISLYDAGNLEAFAHMLKKQTGTIVVAGHSNTTPELIKLLTERDVSIAEDEFDKVFVVTFEEKAAKLTINSSDQ
ncbi:histidine phosphatase family protein [Pseudoalteromonas luteoviolacea]|uniref:SixA phosphatase family protein n=1 Tax=Pseudoalteromonas luteoviolacea TaxID=43657 RepID=UPI001F282E9D|nr:phosphoglycerate mutase family protein [Pseudoalteromonas luteoviolacea]MCF6439801.1 histidine phosphatase family protein [Pseudoalteromonas luteoviolacea]